MHPYQKYEYYCCDHLTKTEGYQKAWTWQNIPENKLMEAKLINNFERLRLERKRLKSKNSLNVNTLQDFGIDLLAEKDGKFLVGQSKCYSNNNPLKRNDLTGFFEYLSIAELDSHLFNVFYTSELCRHIHENVKSGRYRPNLQFVKLPLPLDYIVAVETSHATPTDSIIESIILRDYQLEAISKLHKYFLCNKTILPENTSETTETAANIPFSESDDEDNNGTNKVRKAGILCLPGGTGKTEVFLTFARDNYKYCIILSPTRELSRQTLEDRAKHIYQATTYFKLVDTDGERDVEILKKEITDAMTNNKQIVISSTFKSCDVIKDILNLFSGNINDLLLVVDEFHDIPKTAVISTEHPMNTVLNVSQHVLYVSATPRCYALETAESEDSSVVSTTEYLFGEKIFEFSFRDAVDKGYICDYKLWLPSVWHKSDSENQLKLVEEDLSLDMNGFDIIKRNQYLKMTVLVSWMLQVGLRKVIVYVLPDRNSEVTNVEKRV